MKPKGNVSVKIHRLLRSKRRTIALIVEHDGTLTVRAPLTTGEDAIVRFVEANRDWIIKRQTYVWENEFIPHHYENGELFPFLGKTFRLRLTPGLTPALGLDEDGFRLNLSRQGDGCALFTTWYRDQARQILGERVAYWAQQYGFKVWKVRISSARTRWGSCSRAGTLSFPWRLVMAPMDIIDYVVVHELAHLRQMNHSWAFWKIVASILPDYKQRRAWLKKNGSALQL